MITACPHCGGKINPASLLGMGKKTMTLKALAARKANGKKGGRPKKDVERVNKSPEK